MPNNCACLLTQLVRGPVFLCIGLLRRRNNRQILYSTDPQLHAWDWSVFLRTVWEWLTDKPGVCRMQAIKTWKSVATVYSYIVSRLVSVIAKLLIDTGRALGWWCLTRRASGSNGACKRLVCRQSFGRLPCRFTAMRHTVCASDGRTSTAD